MCIRRQAARRKLIINQISQPASQPGLPHFLPKPLNSSCCWASLAAFFAAAAGPEPLLLRQGRRGEGAAQGESSPAAAGLQPYCACAVLDHAAAAGAAGANSSSRGASKTTCRGRRRTWGGTRRCAAGPPARCGRPSRWRRRGRPPPGSPPSARRLRRGRAWGWVSDGGVATAAQLGRQRGVRGCVCSSAAGRSLAVMKRA